MAERDGSQVQKNSIWIRIEKEKEQMTWAHERRRRSHNCELFELASNRLPKMTPVTVSHRITKNKTLDETEPQRAPNNELPR